MSSSAKKTSTSSSSSSSSSSSDKHVVVKGTEGHLSSDHPKKVTTMKYDLADLKKVRDFDVWIADELESLNAGFELDYSDYSEFPPAEREKELTKKLASVKDVKKRDAFKAEFIKRANEVAIILESGLKKKSSFIG